MVQFQHMWLSSPSIFIWAAFCSFGLIQNSTSSWCLVIPSTRPTGSAQGCESLHQHIDEQDLIVESNIKLTTAPTTIMSRMESQWRWDTNLEQKPHAILRLMDYLMDRKSIFWINCLSHLFKKRTKISNVNFYSFLLPFTTVNWLHVSLGFRLLVG